MSSMHRGGAGHTPQLKSSAPLLWAALTVSLVVHGAVLALRLEPGVTTPRGASQSSLRIALSAPASAEAAPPPTSSASPPMPVRAVPTPAPPHTAKSSSPVAGRKASPKARTPAEPPRTPVAPAPTTDSAPTVAVAKPSHSSSEVDTPTTAPRPDLTSVGGTAASDASTETPGLSETQRAGALKQAVRQALRPHFHYPMLARRRGWEGRVDVGLRIDAAGGLSRLRVVSTSGHGVLDKAAVNALLQIERIRTATEWLPERHFDMVLPVRYRLVDG